MTKETVESRGMRARSFFEAPYGCFWIAALGLALEGTAGEFRKFAPTPDFGPSSADTLITRLLIITLVVAVFLVASSRHEDFVFKNRIWAVAVCIGFSLGLSLYFSGFLFVASGRLPVVLGYYITTVIGIAYLLIWFDRIFAFGIRATLLTVAVSLVMRGLVQMLLVLMQQNPGVVLITAMPLASLPCLLAVFAQSKDLHPGKPNPINMEYAVASSSKLRYPRLALAMLLLMLFLIPLLAGMSDEHTVQISNGLGLTWYRQGSCIGINILVGVLLYLFAKLHFNKTLLLAYLLVVSGLTATAVFTVQNAAPASLVAGSLALQAAKKMLDFGVVFPAFIFSTEGEKRYRWHVAARFGSSLASLIVAIVLSTSASADNPLRGVFDGGLLFALFTTLIVFFFCLEALLPEAKEPAAAAEEPKPLRQPFKEAVAKLAADGRLTPTEETILALVARGSNAESVSKELVVSVNTAKTHIRNIYNKLDVHSQQELIALVNAAKDEIRNSFDE